jgi:hypothetical protein
VVISAAWAKLRRIRIFFINFHHFNDVADMWNHDKKFRLINIVHAALLRVIWLMRNDMCFNRVSWPGMQILWRTNGLFACSMGGDASGRRKRKVANDDCTIGGVSSCTASTVVAGAWVKREKKLKSHHELLVMNLNAAKTGHLKITARTWREH